MPSHCVRVYHHIAYRHHAAVGIDAAAICLADTIDIDRHRDGAPKGIMYDRRGIGDEEGDEGSVADEEEGAHGVGVTVIPRAETVSLIGRRADGDNTAIGVGAAASDIPH